MIWGMQSENFERFKDRLMPFLQNFADRSGGRVKVEDLIERIKDTDSQVWVCGDFQAVAMTHIGPEYVSIDYCSGTDRADWQDDLLSEVEAWAKHHGCQRVFIFGRPGWSKWAKSKGFKEAHREMVREF